MRDEAVSEANLRARRLKNDAPSRHSSMPISTPRNVARHFRSIATAGLLPHATLLVLAEAQLIRPKTLTDLCLLASSLAADRRLCRWFSVDKKRYEINSNALATPLWCTASASATASRP